MLNLFCYIKVSKAEKTFQTLSNYSHLPRQNHFIERKRERKKGLRGASRKKSISVCDIFVSIYNSMNKKLVRKKNEPDSKKD